MKGLLSPFLASLSRLVLLPYPFNRNHRPFDIEHRSPIQRRWRRAKSSPSYLPSRWRPTDPGYLFAQGASHGEALLVREGFSPAFALRAPFLPPSSGYRLQRLRERKPPGHSSLYPALHRAVSLTPFTTKRARP